MNKPTKTLALLIVEDVESDALLIVRLLKKAGYELVYKQVETSTQMRAALKEHTWDFVISDFSLPQFSGEGALAILKETGLDIPFIVISGTMGEETAVAMMKAGAHDYLTKGDLGRLVPAVERELEQAEIRGKRRQAEKALAASEAELRALFASMRDVVLVIDRQGVYRKIAPTNHDLLVKPAEELLGNKLMDVFPVEQADFFIDTIRQVLDTDQTAQIEYELLIGDRTIWFETFLSPMDRDSTLWVARDITERKQAEEALAASEAELRALVEQVPAIVYTESTDTRETTYISPQLEKMTGYTPVEWVNDHKLWEKVIHPEDRAYVIEKDTLTMQTREPFSTEYRILTRDGRTIWIHDEAVMIQRQDGVPLFWQGVMYDITERKQAEVFLQQSQSNLLSALRVAHMGHWEFDVSTQIFTFNDQYYSLHGTNAQEAGGYQMSAQTFAQQYVHPEDASTVGYAIQQAIEATNPNFQYQIEARIMRADGEPRWVTVWFRIEKDAQGQTVKMYGVNQDITERKQTEVQLRKLSRAVDQNPASIVITDLQGNIEYVNPKFSQVTGYSFTEALGQNPRILKSGHTTREEYKKMWDTITSGNIWQGELLNNKKNGETYWEFATIAPVFSEDGKITSFLALKENITERKQAEEGIRQRVSQLEMLYQSGLALTQLLNPKEIGEKIIKLLEEKLNWHHTALCVYNSQDDSLKLLGFNQPGLESEAKKHLVEERFNEIIINSGDGLTGWALQQSRTIRSGDVINDPHYIETYPGIHSGLYTPIKLGDRKIGVIGIESEQPNAFSEADEQLIVTLANQAASALENARLFEETRQRVMELEMLYQSGLALSQLLNPKEIGQKILELLEEKLDWRNTRIRLYHPENDSLELLDFNQPGLNDEMGHREAVERFQSLITHSGEGMSGWVVQHGQSVRSGDVSNDPRYVEAYPGIRSGLYVPMKLGERVMGVISIESEQPNAFSETDERLIFTLANQAASAFENARLFEETRQRVMELETLNRISLVLRAVSKQNEMLAIVLDEALAILNTSHGYIELHNKTTNNFEKVITRGWATQVTEPPQNVHEGIAGRVFTTGEIYVSREFASDPETFDASRSQMPPNWGGACLAIRTSQQTLGVMLVFVPSEHELNKNEIRLLSILSEMTGAALQRMQLHEQTVRRLEQLNALRAVDQAISNSRDMRLTLHILLTHTISQLNVDAADVLLLHPGSTMLEFVAGRGFHSFRLENISLRKSFAGRVILEHLPIMGLTYETVRQNSKFGKIWQDEGFVCYWCVPLIIKGEVKGVLEIYCRKAFTPDAEWFEFLEALAGQAAIAIDNTQLFENLQRANMDLSLAYDATIEGWSRALDLRDHETEGHTLRVTDLTLNLARAMQVGESQLTAIRRGALLHDIGKMGVPDAILLKEGILTDEEWVLMRKHPQFAHDMLLPIAYLHDALDIPYYHHEKWDGTGYPQGLKGNQIPLAARIFAVVDVWDALTNDRTYRKKWTNQQTREHIEEQSGKHFDPQIVEVFLRNIMED